MTTVVVSGSAVIVILDDALGVEVVTGADETTGDPENPPLPSAGVQNRHVLPFGQ